MVIVDIEYQFNQEEKKIIAVILFVIMIGANGIVRKVLSKVGQ